MKKTKAVTSRKTFFALLLTVLLFRSECFYCSQSSLKVLKVSAEKHREK
jgi:hypothetical protein